MTIVVPLTSRRRPATCPAILSTVRDVESSGPPVTEGESTPPDPGESTVAAEGSTAAPAVRHCPNGHEIGPTTRICPECGVPTAPARGSRGAEEIVVENVPPVNWWERQVPRQIAGALVLVGGALICASVFHSWVTGANPSRHLKVTTELYAFLVVLIMGVGTIFMSTRIVFRQLSTLVLVFTSLVAAIDVAALILLDREEIIRAEHLGIARAHLGVGAGFPVAIAGVAVVLAGALFLGLTRYQRR